MAIERVVVHRPGSYDALRIERADMPEPGAGEVRIAVRACGINYADCIVRMGLYSSAREYVGWPITPGFEVAGVIDAVGPGATLPIGARAIGVTRFGGYSSAVTIPQSQVFLLPDTLSFEEGAALPAVALTAWYALDELVHPRAGQSMLVHSAAGGVGSALVQLGKRAGCIVVGVVGSPHKVATVEELGADGVVDKSRGSLWPTARRFAPEGFDAIYDANGIETLRDSYRNVRRPGKLVVYGFATMLPRGGGRVSWPKLAIDYARTPRFDPLAMTNECISVLAFNLSYLFAEQELLQRGMRSILACVADGSLRLPPIARYPLAEVARAQRDLESGTTIGKLVLLP